MVNLNKIKQDYSDLYNNELVQIKCNLDNYLDLWLKGKPRIDRIDSRVKTIDSFVSKASKLDDDGTLKYKNPFVEIQDIIGARVVTFFHQDLVEMISQAAQEFGAIEESSKAPEFDESFGYFGHHFIFFLPEMVRLRDSDLAPRFFELQIKTVFQHAWSQLEHDIGYKPEMGRGYGPSERRLSAHASSLAWGADQAFAELFERTRSGTQTQANDS